jgi:hypothetical protein
MQMRPQNRFSFFDRQLHVMGNVVKPRFSESILNTPFLTPLRFNPAKRAKTNKMNVLHRTTVKIKVCRASERIPEGASISTVVSFPGVPGIVAERNRVVLIGCLCDPEPPNTAHMFPVPQIEERLIQ